MIDIKKLLTKMLAWMYSPDVKGSTIFRGSVDTIVPWDGSSAVTSNTYGIYRFKDQSDDTIAEFAGGRRTDDMVSANVGALNPISGVSNYLTVRVDDTGKRSYTVSDPSAFQNAIGITRGTVTGTTVASKSYRDVNINFGKTYASAPTVVASLGSSSTSADIGSMSVGVVSVTTTGATLRIFNDSGNARTPSVNWIAIG